MQPELKVSSLFARLASARVDFVVIGGIAVIAHGYERNTKDLDICYSPDGANLEALGGVLVDLGARLRGIDPAWLAELRDAQGQRGAHRIRRL